MSKIICDVCGSSYSETATQCPSCGTARSDAAKTAAETVVEEQAPKGGKFSRSNNAKPAPGGKKPAPNKDGKGKDEPASNLPMIIIVTVQLKIWRSDTMIYKRMSLEPRTMRLRFP